MENWYWSLTEWRGEVAWLLLLMMAYLSLRFLFSARKETTFHKHRLVTCGLSTAALLPVGIHPSLGILPTLATVGLVCLACSAGASRSAWSQRFLTGTGLVFLLGSAGMAFSGYVLAMGSGPSMWPTASKHLSLFLMDNHQTTWERGTVISFGVPMAEAASDADTGWPAGRYQKRIIGLPGDWVAIEDYALKVNGQTVADCRPERALERFSNSTWLCAGQLGNVSYRMVWGDPEIWMNGRQNWHVPAGETLVLGDNLPESADSRYRGTVPLRWVSGRFFASW